MVSVIIVNFHSAHLTKKAVKSVLDEKEEIEIFVVDNTATADERHALQSLLPANVILVCNETNEGFGKACNKAYNRSRGDHILLLNPDAYILPGALKALRSVLFSYPDAGAAGPRIYWDEERRFILPPNYLPLPSHELIFAYRCRIPFITHFYALKWRRWSIKVMNSEIPLEQIALSGGSVLLKRSAIEAAGGMFDESYYLYYEDADLFVRLVKAGYKLYLDSKAGVVHHWNQSPEIHISKSDNLIRSHAFYMEKHFKAGYRIIKIFNTSMMFNRDRRISTCIDLGQVRKPICAEVPLGKGDNWLFEWSHNPNLFPAAIMRGSGREFSFPETAWTLFRPGRYYGRFSDPDVFFVKPAGLSWEVS